MAGSQVVLHERNDGKENRKNETRNLGLQSIVDREDSITGTLVNDASRQFQVARELYITISNLDAIVQNLVWIANSIYGVIQNAYISDTTKTQKFIDIQVGASS